jgi:hypothetical protein
MHLHTLNCMYNGMSKAFARNVLLPAVRSNTGLCSLEVAAAAACSDDEYSDVVDWMIASAREAQALLAQRRRSSD